MRSRRRIALILGFVAVSLYTICASAAPDCDRNSKGDCWDEGIEYAGNINGRYPIQMLLKLEGKSFKGYMFYESTAKYIFLQGTVTPKGLATVKEVDEMSKKVTGVFEGQLGEAGFSGTWSSPDGKKRVPFKLTAIPGTAAAFSGQYRCEIKEENFFQTVELKVDHGKVEKFTIISGLGPHWHTCDLGLENLTQERGKPYILLLPDGRFQSESNKLYGDQRERIRVKETQNTIAVQFFGSWRLACGLNALMADVLINKKTGKCKALF
ncbi:MAG: hypothetical protein AABZ10_05555 [Nitrospirota bacterium]